MQIDNSSERSLEHSKLLLVTKNTLLDAIDKTKTAAVGRLVKDFLKSPLIEKKISERHSLIQEFLDNQLIPDTISILTGQPDAERAISRITAKTNNWRDLLLIKNFSTMPRNFLKINELKATLKKFLLPDNNLIKKAKELETVITQNIEDSPPISLNEGGVIKKGVSKELDYLRNIKK